MTFSPKMVLLLRGKTILGQFSHYSYGGISVLCDIFGFRGVCRGVVSEAGGSTPGGGARKETTPRHAPCR